VSTSNNNYYSRPVNYNRIGETQCGLRVRVLVREGRVAQVQAC
jgi:hypothetical protein